ncbi:NADH:ubiquinone oxidoreductase, NDUFA5/B13 subunit [Moesziomyces antarcticus T-34]|uniref:NADH:ubiquinone oxidoreductase, NDUFA5/B13 subunit n=1 Tax=Pseudozyma antarctica (strain T-34) TaxID=1151754 RepID=M9LQK3_PSEA3|nr:NADH:ubiquinone oxidoreductase, NDUFA5/B13 subunit [Moesziomyces antarcticus T-34]
MHATRTALIARTLMRHASPSASHAPPAPFAARLKKSTNITGVEVAKSPLEQLESRYTQTLHVLKSMPEASVYRQATMALTQHRLDVVLGAKNEADKVRTQPEQLEKIYEQAEVQIDAGQLEQVLEQAQAEYKLAAKMVDWKAWEPLEHPPAPGQWSYFSMAEEAGEGGEDHGPSKN